MKPRHRGMKTVHTECPVCGEAVTYRKRPGIKRFRPKTKACDNCGEVWR